MKEKFLEFVRSLQKGQSLYWFIAIGVAAFLAFYWDSTQHEKPTGVHEAESADSASTFIPAGFVLVPIEIANYESLDSILGKFGVVDLYRPAVDPRIPPVKVAEHIKILRAPLNPSHFAVLAPESESQRIVAFNGPFVVVVQNPEQSGTRFVNGTPQVIKAAPRRVSRITVEGMDGSEN